MAVVIFWNVYLGPKLYVDRHGLTFEPKPCVTYVCLLCGCHVATKKKLSSDLTNELYVMWSKSWSARDRRPSFVVLPATEVVGMFVKSVTLEWE